MSHLHLISKAANTPLDNMSQLAGQLRDPNQELTPQLRIVLAEMVESFPAMYEMRDAAKRSEALASVK